MIMGKISAIEWTDATWNCWHGCEKVSPGCAHCYMYRDKTRYGQNPMVVMRSKPSTFNAPLRWHAPARVFTCSWSDFFIAAADDWRGDAWEIIRATPHLTYQILTKRPERIATRLPSDWGNGWPHVWLGVSVENARWQHRIDVLRAIPAAERFLSLEPLLGPLPALTLAGISWVIVGGESGPKARPMRPEWVRDIRDQCREQTVPFFFKQWGGTNTKKAGRLLDGQTWDEYPVRSVAIEMPPDAPGFTNGGQDDVWFTPGDENQS